MLACRLNGFHFCFKRNSILLWFVSLYAKRLAKKLVALCHLQRSNTKTNRDSVALVLSGPTVFALSFDWFSRMCVQFVTVQIIYFGFDFTTHKNCSKSCRHSLWCQVLLIWPLTTRTPYAEALLFYVAFSWEKSFHHFYVEFHPTMAVVGYTGVESHIEVMGGGRVVLSFL